MKSTKSRQKVIFTIGGGDHHRQSMVMTVYAHLLDFLGASLGPSLDLLRVYG